MQRNCMSPFAYYVSSAPVKKDAYDFRKNDLCFSCVSHFCRVSYSNQQDSSPHGMLILAVG